MDDERLAADPGVGGRGERRLDLLAGGVLPHRPQQGFAAGLDTVSDLNAARCRHRLQQGRVNGVDPGQRRPGQVKIDDRVADVGDLPLVDDKVVVNDGEPPHPVPVDEVGQLGAGAGPGPVLDAGLPSRAERAREWAPPTEHHVRHPDVPAGEPVGHHDVLVGQQMPGRQRQSVNVLHQPALWLDANLPVLDPAGATNTGEGAAGAGPVQHLDDRFFRLALAEHIRAEVG